MSHPSWLPPKSTNEPVGHVTARMETTHTFGTPSISVSTQQTPKKFAPVVAPKPKYNPYKQPGGDGDFLPPPPPPVDDLGNITSSQGAFPPPPPLDDVTFNVQVNPGGKTLEERRSSLDAEIDSLTSILADLESSSPYKPRTQQDSFFTQVMTSESNTDFQPIFISMDGKNKTSQQMRSSKESNAAASKSNDVPEALQEVNGDGAAENIMERIKMAEKKKDKQSNDVDRTSRKRKSENNEKLAVTQEETTLETGNQLIPTPLSHIPLKSLTDIEMELVYTDEEDIPFEFAGPVVPTSTQSACRDSEKAKALSAPNGSALPQINKQLQMTLREASACYRQKNYAAAAERFSTALELCSKGVAIEKPFESSPEDISSIASFIETKLVTCYLKLMKPDDALNHSHRSIILNPAYFRNHLRQAAVFRCLERYSEAARSAMIADYMYWLTGGTEQHISKLIKLYWQAMIEEAITREESFSVMYTPFVTEVKADKINKIKDMFAEKHPDYVEHIYTDPHGLHFLPQMAEWPSLPPQQYLLTLGFRNKHIGKILERWSSRKLPIFSDRKAPFSPLTKEETKRYWDNTGKKIVPVMDFVRSTKLTDNLCACSRGIEKLHYASLLGRLQRVEERSQVINQAMAELATIPYLQDISQQDAELLQSLMADAMDTLEGRSDKGRVWNKIQKIGLIEDYLYQVEDNYLKNKRLRTARTEKMKMKRTQSTQQHQSLGNTELSLTSPKDMAT